MSLEAMAAIFDQILVLMVFDPFTTCQIFKSSFSSLTDTFILKLDCSFERFNAKFFGQHHIKTIITIIIIIIIITSSRPRNTGLIQRGIASSHGERNPLQLGWQSF